MKFLKLKEKVCKSVKCQIKHPQIESLRVILNF